MIKLLIQTILVIVGTFLTLVAVQIAADEIVFARRLWSLLGAYILICWALRVLKQILRVFLKVFR